jgi:hypothetical protein
MAVEVLTAESFEPHVGKTVLLDGTGKELRMDRIEKQGASPGTPREPFIVIFSAPRDQQHFVPEGTYECRVENGPSWTLYLIPVNTPVGGRQEYQASFN